MHDILDVIKNIQELYENDSGLATLKDFERVLDEMDIYAFDHWEDGELAFGPQVERYWITAGFMWPRDNMPDTGAAERLAEIGCKIKYQKSYLIEPRKVKTPDDFRPGTKKGRLDHIPIWVVEIRMPKKLAFDIYKSHMVKMRNDIEQSLAPKERSIVQAPAPVPPQSTQSPQPGLPPQSGGMPSFGGTGMSPGGMPT